MIYLLAATEPMYFEAITYYTDKFRALGVANYLNLQVGDHSDLHFVIQEIPENRHIKIISEYFFGEEE